MEGNHIKDYAGFVLVNILTSFAPALESLNLRDTLIGSETINGVRDLLASAQSKVVSINLASNRL